MTKILILPALLLLAGCSTNNEADQAHQWHAQSNTIEVVRQKDGRLVPTPPACPSFDEARADTLMNDPLPQLGCSTAGNLARMVVDPSDLVRGEVRGDREPEHALNGTVGAAAVQRYQEGKVYVPVTGSTSGSGSSQ